MKLKIPYNLIKYNTTIRYLSTHINLYNRRLSDPENKGGHTRGVNFDTLGSWNNRLELELHVEESIKTGVPIPRITFKDVGHATLMGRRSSNEDRMCISRLTKSAMMFAIFDGHSGSVAAHLASSYLSIFIRHWLDKAPDFSKSLRNAFLEFDNFLSYKLNRFRSNGGCTATVAILRDNQYLSTAHIGDSNAVLCRKGIPVKLSNDHSPDDSKERERIEKYGGKIVSSSIGRGRVQGRLEMSRCFGDTELKFYGVTANPDIRHIKIKHGYDAFLVLTTDGVTYSLNDQEIIDLVSSCDNAKDAANLLTDQALHFGSEDNASALVIPLGAWGKYAGTTQAIRHSFGRTTVGKRY